jgi:hypothetical protein
LTATYVRFLALRMAIFLVVLVILIALHLQGLLAVVLALLISGVLSYPLARRQRDDIVRAFQQRRDR